MFYDVVVEKFEQNSIKHQADNEKMKKRQSLLQDRVGKFVTTFGEHQLKEEEILSLIK